MRVTLTAGTMQADEILTVFCLIGDHVPQRNGRHHARCPPGIINFNKVVTGENVYIRTD